MPFKNNFSQQRLQKIYEREINYILFKLNKELKIPACSVTSSELSRSKENLKIYLTFQSKNEEAVLTAFNKKYIFLIRKRLTNSKKFSCLPQIIFFLDWQLENLINLEKIIQRNQK